MELYLRVSDTPAAMEAVYEYALVAAGDAFTEAEVSAALDLPKTTTHVALGVLVAEGLVVQERVGRTGRYSVDPADPLTRQLKIARTIRLLQQAVLPLRDELDLVTLFGSASRGEDRQGSDVDVLVVARGASAVQTSLARHQWLQPVVLTPEQHMALIAENGTLAKEIARGITIWRKP